MQGVEREVKLTKVIRRRVCSNKGAQVGGVMAYKARMLVHKQQRAAAAPMGPHLEPKLGVRRKRARDAWDG